MRPKSEIYIPKRDDEHPRRFHMAVIYHMVCLRLFSFKEILLQRTPEMHQRLLLYLLCYLYYTFFYCFKRLFSKYTFLGNCPPTPPLSGTKVLMLA